MQRKGDDGEWKKTKMSRNSMQQFYWNFELKCYSKAAILKPGMIIIRNMF